MLKDIRGKKSRLMRCGCCVCRDLRDDMFRKIAQEEIQAALEHQELEQEIRYFGELPL